MTSLAGTGALPLQKRTDLEGSRRRRCRLHTVSVSEVFHTAVDRVDIARDLGELVAELVGLNFDTAGISPRY